MSTTAPWIRVGRLTFRRRMALASTGAGVLLVVYPGFVLGPQITAILLPEWSLGLRLVLSVLGGTVVALLVLAVIASLYPGLQVRADGSEIRLRKRVSLASALDRASLLTPQRTRDRLDLVLQLGVGGRTTRLWLRSRDRVLLGEEERSVLARALERSSIAPPTSVHDPSGRFARYNFPGSLTREEALAVVRQVPASSDPLPLGDRGPG